MGGGTDLSRLTAPENCLLGMVTGAMSKGTNYPFLVWKNAAQQGLPMSINPFVVYRGVPMACFNLGATSAVQFVLAGWLQRSITASGGSAEATQLGGAFLAGLGSGLPCNLWELVMIQQQRFGGTILGTPARIVREQGWSILGRGVTLTAGRESTFCMAMLGITPLIQTSLIEKSGMDSNAALSVGALAGALFAGTVTHPMDTIKTCMQGDLGQAKYTGILSSARVITQEHGVVQGLFKGLFWRCALISTSFFIVNKYKSILVPHLFPHAAERSER